MPLVKVLVNIETPAEEVWRAVTDVESYPLFMENVRAVRLIHQSGDVRTTEWETVLRGSILQWIEREEIDDQKRRLTFQQVDGDLDHFDGYWQVCEHNAASSTAELFVDFNIGIPLLDEMLNPVAERALRDNSERMLREIERQVAHRP